MPVKSAQIQLSTNGEADVIDITPEVSRELKSSKIIDGIVTVSVIGSTGALTTCEFEPGLVADIKDIFNKLIPHILHFVFKIIKIFVCK